MDFGSDAELRAFVSQTLSPQEFEDILDTLGQRGIVNEFPKNCSHNDFFRHAMDALRRSGHLFQPQFFDALAQRRPLLNDRIQKFHRAFASEQPPLPLSPTEGSQTYVLRADVDVSALSDEQKNDLAVKFLKAVIEVTGNPNITISTIKEGSLLLHLKGLSGDDAVTLREALRDGRFEQALGEPVSAELLAPATTTRKLSAPANSADAVAAQDAEASAPPGEPGPGPDDSVYCLLSRKLGMTRLGTQDGISHPVTILVVGDYKTSPRPARHSALASTFAGLWTGAAAQALSDVRAADLFQVGDQCRLSFTISHKRRAVVTPRVQSTTVVKIDEQKGLLYVRGGVSSPTGGMIVVQKAIKDP